MKNHSWNQEKSSLLKSERGVSFEDIIYYIQKGNLLAIIRNPNQEKYSGQKIYIVEINNNAYLVPFVESEHEVFLKTIIPSRKATKIYLREKKNED